MDGYRSCFSKGGLSCNLYSSLQYVQLSRGPEFTMRHRAHQTTLHSLVSYRGLASDAELDYPTLVQVKDRESIPIEQ